ncbi:MAG: CoA transferase [Burkholderiaceae bacterium]
MTETPRRPANGQSPAADTADRDPQDKLLDGFVVLDFTRVLAGPYCTRLLADLGATVIKIERPGEGDEVRYIGLQLDEQRIDSGAYFARMNAGKQSIAIDLANPDSRPLVLDLVSKADVVIENFSPGVMAKYRLDAATLCAIKPELVYCSISGFGQTGPLSAMQAYAHLINAISGMMDLERGGVLAPRASNLQAADVLAGAHAFGAICAALLRRSRTGKGARLDVSMLECMVAADDVTYPVLLNGGSIERRPRVGMVVHPIGDRHVAMQVGSAAQVWPRIVGWLERPDLIDDPRFSTAAARRGNWDALSALLAERLARFPTVEAAVDALRGARIPSAPVLTAEEIVEHPHMAARRAFPTIPHPKRGEVKVTAAPFQVDGDATHPAGPAPYRIGEHTQQVLTQVLGYPAQRIRELETGKVIESPHGL